MGRRFLLITSLWIAGWVAWPGAIALAAEGEGADMEAVIQELRAENPQLSESEARKLAALAAQDLREGEGTAARDLAAGTATEQAGILVQGPTGLGASELGGGYIGGGSGSEMTPEEHALAEKMGARVEQLKDEGLSPEEVDATLKEEFAKEFEQFREMEKAWHEAAPGERDDARLRDLQERGVPGIERAHGLEGREGAPTKEQIERYREMEKEHSAPREMPSADRESTVERERSWEAPVHESAEQPSVERESTVMEHEALDAPEYERPPQEYPSY